MSKYNASRREDIEELIRTPSMRSLISQHRSRIDQFLKHFKTVAGSPHPGAGTLEPERLE